ncbi:MAG TPA: methyltransferase [Phycisphaerales bacterium]|nr:methyltransferase [Phycisphaerales bacterium]
MPDAHADITQDFLDTLHGSWKSQALHAAAALNVADVLAAGPLTAGEVARRCGTATRPMRQLLRALATIRVCVGRADGTFSLGPLGGPLRSDAPNSLRSWTLWWGTNQWGAWGVLPRCVETGKGGRALIHGTEGFDHLADPAVASLFHRAIAELTALTTGGVVKAGGFDRFETVVDVGGGRGELLAAVLATHPRLRGTLFELEHALAPAREDFISRGVAERCAFVAGDFFKAVPAGADAYLLKSVLHDWDDAECAAILGRCREAMTARSRLLVVEQVMPDAPGTTRVDQALARSDLMMLVAHGSCERTEGEYRRLLAGAGLQLDRATPAAGTFSVLEASPSI